MYKHQEFPKWKYHGANPPKLVNSANEEQALGAEWVDSPADLSADEIEVSSSPLDEQYDIKVDLVRKKPGRPKKVV